MFSRMRIRASGQLLEDIGMYKRFHDIFNILRATYRRENGYVDGFSRYLDKPMSGFRHSKHKLLSQGIHLLSQ